MLVGELLIQDDATGSVADMSIYDPHSPRSSTGLEVAERAAFVSFCTLASASVPLGKTIARVKYNSSYDVNRLRFGHDRLLFNTRALPSYTP